MKITLLSQLTFLDIPPFLLRRNSKHTYKSLVAILFCLFLLEPKSRVTWKTGCHLDMTVQTEKGVFAGT